MKRTSCGLEGGEDGGQVALALQHRPAGDVEAHAELGGDDAGQRGLAQPRRPGEQHVVEGLAALAGRLQEDAELLLDALLADEVVEPARAQGAVELVLGADARRRSASRSSSLTAASARPRPWRTRPSASRPAGASARAASASSGRKPSATRPSRADR